MDANKGVLRVDYEHVGSDGRNTWKAKEKLLQWATSTVKDDKLGVWIDTHIVTQTIDMSNQMFYSRDAMNEVRWILKKYGHQIVTKRMWISLFLQYLRQFFAYVSYGKNGNPSWMAKKMETDEWNESRIYAVIQFITEGALRMELNCKRKFPEEEEEGEELPSDDEVVSNAVQKPIEEAILAKLARMRDRAPRVDPPPPPPPPPPSKDAPNPKKRKRDERKEVNIVTIMINDTYIMKRYDRMTRKPWSDMIYCRDWPCESRPDIKLCMWVNPCQLTKAGKEIVSRYYNKHCSTYLSTPDNEFNAWSPLLMRFDSPANFLNTGNYTGRKAWKYGLGEKVLGLLGPVMEHIYTVYCAKNEYNFKVFMNFFAHAVQRGWENANITLNIQGDQGILKSQVEKNINTYFFVGARECFFPIEKES